MTARKVWEEAIAAKGGRQKLHAIQNIVISSRATYASPKSKNNQITSEALYVFPNRVWSWSDLRPDVFGLWIEMYNYETNMKYVVTDGDPHSLPEPIKPGDKKHSRMYGLAAGLLETKWSQPIPKRAYVGLIGQQSVDIVETLLDGERIDFALDRRTHLPVRVSFYTIDKAKTYVTEVLLSDYMDFSGLKMPTIVKPKDGTTHKQSYQFNVAYDESIFVKPPPLGAGRHAWRRKDNR